MPFAPTNFRAIPRGMFCDDRIKLQHLRVTSALLQAVDAETGVSIITGERIARLAGRTRKNALRALEQLILWGYVAKTARGRREGRDPTHKRLQRAL